MQHQATLPSFAPFLSVRAPVAARVRSAIEARPYFEVGGDFHGVVRDRAGNVAAFIGDVSGKGAAVAGLAEELRRQLTVRLQRGGRPGEVLAEVNTWLEARNQHDIFASVACARIDLGAGRASVATAGHLCPLVKRAGRGDCARFDSPPSPALGVLPDVRYGETHFAVGPGDTLLFVTDGISDAFAQASDPIGEEGLRHLITFGPRSVAALTRTVFRAAEENLADDATVLGLQVEG
jgi:serine phosphatase RsbU (regulator of sigma subunit)